jgi:hypothetical protein
VGLFLRQPIGIHAGEGTDQRGLAVVDMAGGRNGRCIARALGRGLAAGRLGRWRSGGGARAGSAARLAERGGQRPSAERGQHEHQRLGLSGGQGRDARVPGRIRRFPSRVRTPANRRAVRRSMPTAGGRSSAPPSTVVARFRALPKANTPTAMPPPITNARDGSRGAGDVQETENLAGVRTFRPGSGPSRTAGRR